MFPANDESEEEEELASNISLRHQNRFNEGPTVLVGTEAAKEPATAEKPVAVKEPKATKKTRRVKIDNLPKPKVGLASLTISDDRVELSKHYDVNPESS